MPEPAVAQDAGNVSEPSLAGGEGALQLSDEDILGIEPEGATPPTVPPAGEPEVPTEPAPTKPEGEPATPPAPIEEPLDDLKWMRPLLNDKAFGPRLQSMHDRLLAFQELYPKVADARSVKELLPGGLEELKSLIASKKEMDEGDLQFFSGDDDQQRPYLENLQRENPVAFQSAVQIGLELIRSQSPQEWEQLTQHWTGRSLEADRVWDWLEYLHETSQKRPEDIPSLLNQFAATFQKYGLGPKSDPYTDPNMQRLAQARSEVEAKYEQLQSERRKEFNENADKTVYGALDTDIGGQLSKLLPKTSEGLRGRIARDVHGEIQKAIREDAGLKLRLANLMRNGGINRQTQEQVSNLLISKARLIMPGAVKRVVNEYTASVMASRQAVNDKQAAAASRTDVSGARPNPIAQRAISKEEANGMSFEDILNSNRPGRR